MASDRRSVRSLGSAELRYSAVARAAPINHASVSMAAPVSDVLLATPLERRHPLRYTSPRLPSALAPAALRPDRGLRWTADPLTYTDETGHRRTAVTDHANIETHLDALSPHDRIIKLARCTFDCIGRVTRVVTTDLAALRVRVSHRSGRACRARARAPVNTAQRAHRTHVR
jgi:hypothetical protein